MPVLKAPPQQPKNETIQLRVPQDVKFRLARYADFINTSSSFIVVELLERLFRKDAEFQAYLAVHKPPDSADLGQPGSSQSPQENGSRR